MFAANFFLYDSLLVPMLLVSLKPHQSHCTCDWEFGFGCDGASVDIGDNGL